MRKILAILTVIGTLALPAFAFASVSIVVAPSQTSDWTTLQVQYPDGFFSTSTYSADNGYNFILYNEDGTPALGDATSLEFNRYPGDFYINDQIVDGAVPHGSYYLVTQGNGAIDYSISAGTTLSDLETQSLTADSGSPDPDFHISNLFTYSAPEAAPAGLGYAVPTSTAPALTADIGAQFSDPGTLLFLGIAFGLPLAFVIFYSLLDLIPGVRSYRKKRGML